MWDDLLKLKNWHEIIAQIQQRYGMVIQKFRLVNAGVSCIFYLTTPKYQAYYVRFSHPKFHNLEQVTAACDFQNYLHYHSAYVPTIRVDINKQSAISLDIDDEQYSMSIAAAAYGELASPLDTNPELWRAVGESIAKMHLASSHFDKSPNFISWQNLWEETVRHKEHLPKDFAPREFAQLEAWLQSLPQDDDVFGITHADCRPGNFIFDGERVTIIDFDEPVYHWFAADIARALVELYDLADEERREACSAMLQIYHKFKPINAQLCGWLPYFMRMKDMDLYSWCKQMGEDVPNTSLSLASLEKRLTDTNWYQNWAFLQTCLD